MVEVFVSEDWLMGVVVIWVGERLGFVDGVF